MGERTIVPLASAVRTLQRAGSSSASFSPIVLRRLQRLPTATATCNGWSTCRGGRAIPFPPSSSALTGPGAFPPRSGSCPRRISGRAISTTTSTDDTSGCQLTGLWFDLVVSFPSGGLALYSDEQVGEAAATAIDAFTTLRWRAGKRQGR